jgi:hypothetical protein
MKTNKWHAHAVLAVFFVTTISSGVHANWESQKLSELPSVVRQTISNLLRINDRWRYLASGLELSSANISNCANSGHPGEALLEQLRSYQLGTLVEYLEHGCDDLANALTRGLGDVQQSQSFFNLSLTTRQTFAALLNVNQRWDHLARELGFEFWLVTEFGQTKDPGSALLAAMWKNGAIKVGKVLESLQSGRNDIIEVILKAVKAQTPQPIVQDNGRGVSRSRPQLFSGELVVEMGASSEFGNEFMQCPVPKLGAQSALFVLDGIEACSRQDGLTTDRCGLNVILQAIDIQPQADLFYMALSEKWDLSSTEAFIPVYNQMTTMFQNAATLKTLSVARLLFRFLESEKRQVTLQQFLTDAIDVMTKEQLMTDTVLPLAKGVLNGLGGGVSGKAAFNRNKKVRDIFTNLGCADIVADKGGSLIAIVIATEEFNPSADVEDQKDAMEVIYNNFKKQCTSQNGIKLDLWYKKWLRSLDSK